MDLDDAQEYTEALGQVVAGGWRQIALGERLGVPEALGMTTREWVERRLGGYVRLSIPERRDAVKELAEEGLSTRDVADVLGVDHSTVVRDQKADEPAGADAPPGPQPEPKPQVDEVADEPAGADAPPEPLAPNEDVTEFLDSDQDIQEAKYLHEFYRVLTRSDDFMEFDPQRVAALADEDVAHTIDDHVTRVRNFADQFHKARPSLHVINGGAR